VILVLNDQETDCLEAILATLHILAAVAEHEREMISQRTSAGLAAAKARGKQLGTYSKVLAAQNSAAAAARDAKLEPVLRELNHLSGCKACKARGPWPNLT
jgi:DNA invertase Pin-like site-specific DNA recombinase